MHLQPHQRCDHILATQHGVISRTQALACGLSSKQIQYRLRTGRWVRLRAGVYRSAVVADGRDARSMAALLGAPEGAVFSHFSAARLHGLDVRPGSPLVWVTIPHNSKRVQIEGVRLLRSRTVEHFTAHLSNRPVTTVARTLTDLGEFLPIRKAKGVVYDALRERRTNPAELTRAWAAVAKRGRPNVFGQVLAELEEGVDSVLEAEAAEVLQHHGIHLERQYRVRSRGRIIRRYDLAEPILKIGIEIDGVSYHSSTAVQARDRRKDRDVAALGWLTLRFTTDDVRKRPREMATTVRRVLAQRTGGIHIS